jgi:hypothetical protein
MSLFEKMSKDKKLEEAKRLFQESVSIDGKWQREAREDFAFRDGKQWTEDERQILNAERRPCLTFNLTKSSVDLIMGMNEDNKIQYRCSPVAPEDGFLAEVLNDLTEWVQETNSFGDEEDAALESAAISGRGWVAIDFVPDPKRFGEIVMNEVNIPVHEIHFDPSARRRDLSDAAYIFWDRWMTIADFRMRYPKLSEQKVQGFVDGSKRSEPESVQRIFEDSRYETDKSNVGTSEDADYSRPMDLEYYDKSTNQIRVIHAEYWCPFKRYFAFNPTDGKWAEFDGKNLKQIKEAFAQEFPDQEFTYETLMDKKVYWLQFTGSDILFDGISPLPYDGFTIVPLFVFGDASKRTMNHYGIVRLLKDPQKEVNKRWSQTLNMLNQQVQTGVYAEVDTFVNVQQAEQSMKEAGSITYLNSGAMAGNKLKERTVPKFPDAPMQMEQYSQDIMKKISGINPDLLGQDRGRQEPGVVVRLRQQQGMTLLKPLFRAVNNMKKELFKRQLSILMAYMPDEQILRILGDTERYQIDPAQGIIIDTMSVDKETGQPTVTAEIRDVRNLEYNIIAEEAPGNMSKRMMELSALLEMQGQGFPVPPEQIIEKMSISESEKQRWLQYLSSQSEAQQKQQEEMLQMQMEIQNRELAIKEQANQITFLLGSAKVKQAATKDEIKAETERMGQQMEAQASAREAQIALVSAQQDLQIKEMEARQKIMAERVSQDNKIAAEKESANVRIGAQKEAADQQLQASRAMTRHQLVAAAADVKTQMVEDQMKLEQLQAEHTLKLNQMKAEARIKEELMKHQSDLQLEQKKKLMKEQAKAKPKPKGDSKK